jgi:phage FluMu protein Com
MSHVRCRNCSLIIEASPRPPYWRCPNCRAVNPSTPMPAATAVDSLSARWFELRGH